jgi:hypothetical protein
VALVQQKAQAVARVNRLRGDHRRLYITDISGQDGAYFRKHAQALAFVQETAPDMADYRWIEAEVGKTAPTAWEVAQVYLNASHLFDQIGPAIESVCFTAFGAIETATDAEAIEAALAELDLALEAIP